MENKKHVAHVWRKTDNFDMNFWFAIAVDLNKCLQKIRFLILVRTVERISELLYVQEVVTLQKNI